jgi:hypothetical protein
MRLLVNFYSVVNLDLCSDKSCCTVGWGMIAMFAAILRGSSADLTILWSTLTRDTCTSLKNLHQQIWNVAVCLWLQQCNRSPSFCFLTVLCTISKLTLILYSEMLFVYAVMRLFTLNQPNFTMFPVSFILCICVFPTLFLLCFCVTTTKFALFLRNSIENNFSFLTNKTFRLESWWFFVFH